MRVVLYIGGDWNPLLRDEEDDADMSGMAHLDGMDVPASIGRLRLALIDSVREQLEGAEIEVAPWNPEQPHGLASVFIEDGEKDWEQAEKATGTSVFAMANPAFDAGMMIVDGVVETLYMIIQEGYWRVAKG